MHLNGPRDGLSGSSPPPWPSRRRAAEVMTATQPPRPAAIGSVELGGLEDNNPATCTYSIGGDVGAGVVSITIGEPFFCSALERALDAGSLEGTNAVAVEFGDGGIVERDGGTIQFAIGGGCIASASLMSSVV